MLCRASQIHSNLAQGFATAADEPTTECYCRRLAAAASLLGSGPECLLPGPSKTCGTPTLAKRGDLRQVQTGAGHRHSCLLPEAGALLGLRDGSCSQQCLGELLCCLTWSSSRSARLEGCLFFSDMILQPVPAFLSEHTAAALLPTASLGYVSLLPGWGKVWVRVKSNGRTWAYFPLLSCSHWCVHGAHPAFLLWNLPQGSFTRQSSHELLCQIREQLAGAADLLYAPLLFPELGQGTDNGRLHIKYLRDFGRKWRVEGDMHSPCPQRNYKIITSNRDVFYKWVVNISQTGIWAIKDLCLSFLRATVIFYSRYRKPRKLPCFKRFSIAFGTAQRPLPIRSPPLALSGGHSCYHHMQPYSGLWGTWCLDSKYRQDQLVLPVLLIRASNSQQCNNSFSFNLTKKRSCPERISKHLKN